MNTDEHDRLQLRELAGAVADESAIDWEAELRSSAHFESKLRQLRLIESIASAYRSLPSGGGRQVAGRSSSAGVDSKAAESPDASVTPTVTSAGPAPALTPERWGSLEIRERLGGGAYGEVYRAHDPTLVQDVALKLLHSARESSDEEDERFLNEARQLARVRHPNVLVVHGADRHDGRIGLWTDLVRGKTLEDELEQRGRYGGQEAALIAIDLCHALAAVHAEDLIHRDVKTANVMREEGGKIVLLDFSAVSKRAVRGMQHLPDTLTGTPLFMAPESFAGVDSGRRTDIYALGVVIYRLVTGKYPVEAKKLTELLRKHGEFRHTPLSDARPDLPAALIAVVEQALHVDPEQRFGSMGEMEQALAAAIGVPTPAPLRREPDDHPVIPQPAPRRRPWTSILAAVLVVAVALFVWNRIQHLPGSFEVEASLQKSTPSGPESLDQGAQIQPEDKLFLELKGTQPMYVYVVNVDNSGHETVLFPLDHAALQNPIAADVMHELPGVNDGSRVFWRVDSSDGGDSIIVLASRERVPEVESVFAQLPHAGDDPSPSEDPTDAEDFVGRLRGIGGLVEAQPGSSEGATKIMRSARREDVWIWEWLLANP